MQHFVVVTLAIFLSSPQLPQRVGWKKVPAVRMEMVIIDMVLKESNITPTKRRNPKKTCWFQLNGSQ